MGIFFRLRENSSKVCIRAVSGGSVVIEGGENRYVF